MFSKEETTLGKQAFWTAFGRYMQPVRGADGELKKWTNYETGVPGLYLRVFLQNNAAYAGIELTDAGGALAETLLQTLPVLRRFTNADWDWMAIDTRPSDSLFLGTVLRGKNPVLQSHWPDLIAFFKQNLLAMDAYWAEARIAFELMD